MFMPAIIGTIAQEGQTATASAPTNVSIATSSSGNYDDAVVVNGEAVDNSNNAVAFFDLDGSGFSGGGDITELQSNQMGGAYNGLTPSETFVFKGYCRATGATSFLWDVTIDSNTDVNNLSLGVIGTASTSQDATGSNGVGEKVEWDFAGGKGGTTYPETGMTLIMKINCTATNAHGSTAADEIEIVYNFN
jgi:hypothetical protein